MAVVHQQHIEEPFFRVPLVDACVTEWRSVADRNRSTLELCHSLMPVLLNGGTADLEHSLARTLVPLVDACVTEWRIAALRASSSCENVPLVDACVTEWRPAGNL